jgi:Alpha/beta hydrolase
VIERRRLRVAPTCAQTTDSLAVSARHAANQLVLNRERAASNADVARLQADLALATAEAAARPPRYAGRGVPNSAQINTVLLQRRLDEAIRHRDMLAAVQAQLDADPGARTLLMLDTAGDGRAAIALGPIDTARHVAIVVPGLEQDVREDLDSIIFNADRLKKTAEEQAFHLSMRESVATVAWIGYDTPNFAQVTSPEHAERGAVYLRKTIDGLDAAREATRAVATGDGRPAPLHLTVVGHSYGSLTTGIAVREPTQVDDVAFIGSPGVGADNVSELRVPEGHVFVGETSVTASPTLRASVWTRTPTTSVRASSKPTVDPAN